VAQTTILSVGEDPMEHAEKTLEYTQSLEQQCRIFDSTLSSLVDFFHTIDREGRCLYANKPLLDLWGLTLENALGKNLFDLQYPAKLAERLHGQIQQVFDTGQRLCDETPYTSPAGAAGCYEYIFCPVLGTSGAVELVAGMTRDITTRKRAESQLVLKIEELNRSNAELDQFASLASHDLQEPLRMVASYTQLLAKRYKGKLDADADEFIAFAVEGANRMQRLIQDLLLYSRVGTAGGDLLNTSSEKGLRQALKNLGASIEESGALVSHDPLPMVQADEKQLTQLFQNLVGNAIKYQGPGIPRVHISATRNDTKWMFSVKDNGLGIEKQYFEKIFVMFQRLHKREEFTGTGIGLAICKKIVERHGGRISVESQLGQGSTFHFALAEGKAEGKRMS
jgi:PAS domain S-box-containing protein